MKTVIYQSCKYYECACGGDVVLCLTPGLTVSGSNFIDASVTTMLQTKGACGDTVYNYYIEYDETLLIPTHQTLYSFDITGLVCSDCLTSWIEALVDNVVIPPGDWVAFSFLTPDDQGTTGTFGTIECFYKLQDGDLLFSCNFHFTPESTVPQLKFNPAAALPDGTFKERIFAWAVEAPSTSEDAGDQQLACRVLVDKSATSLQTFVIHRSDDAIDNTLGNNHYEFAGGTEYQISFSGRARLHPEPIA